MAKIVRRRRGSTADHSAFTGDEGEITVDLTEKTVRVHDGETLTGLPLARKDMSNVSDTVGVTQLAVSEGTNGQLLQTNGAGTLSFVDPQDISAAPIGGDLSGTIANAQINANTITVQELAVSEGTNGQVLQTNGAGTLSFVGIGLGGDLSGSVGNAQINANTVNIAELNVSDGTTGQVLSTNGSGDLFFTENYGGAGAETSIFIENLFVGDGSTVTFSPLTRPVPSEESIMLFIDGVAQPTTAYTLPTMTSITLSSAPATGSNIRILHLGMQTYILDNSVNGAKIAMGADAEGDIMYHNGTDYRRLELGSNGQLLTVNDGSTAPEWKTIVPPPGPSGNLLTSDGTNWTSIADEPHGKVLQVKSSTKTDTYSLANGTDWTSVPGLSVSITPSTVNSKIFVFGTITMSSTTVFERVHSRISRDSTPIAIGDAWGDRTQQGAQWMDGQYHSAGNSTIQTLDVPATVSPLTYSWQINTQEKLSVGGFAVINRNGLEDDSAYYGTFVSTITVFEIGV